MKKKNGFTLIELIVTIAIILSVMVLAIIGFNNISKSKKEESFEIVKKTVESAAADYITSNKYLLETLSPSSKIVKITLGTLVKEDYLDKVTNPINGKSLNKCSIVEISKEDGGYNYRYDDTNVMSDCNNVNNEIVEVTDSMAPNLTITPIGTMGNNGWYKRNNFVLSNDYTMISDEERKVLGIKIKIEASIKKGFLPNGIQIQNSNTGKWDDLLAPLNIEENEEELKRLTAYDVSTYATTIKNKKTCYRAISSSGDTSIKCVTYSVDTDIPTCSAKMQGGYDSDKKAYYTVGVFKPLITMKSNDIGSGINTMEYSDPTIGSITEIIHAPYISPVPQGVTNGVKDWKGYVSDKAGNEGSCTLPINVYSLIREFIDNSVKNRVYCAETDGESTSWTNQNRTITQHYKTIGGADKGSVSETFTTSGRNATITKEGVSCSVNKYIDKTAPSFTSSNVNNVYLYQYDTSGGLIGRRKINVNKTSNGVFEADVCLVNVSGSFEITGFVTSANDTHSGINSDSWYTNKITYDRNNNMTSGCLITKGQNPCKRKYEVYVSDNAGNKAKVANYNFRVGYHKNPNVPNRSYDTSFCTGSYSSSNAREWLKD